MIRNDVFLLSVLLLMTQVVIAENDVFSMYTINETKNEVHNSIEVSGEYTFGFYLVNQKSYYHTITFTCHSDSDICDFVTIRTEEVYIPPLDRYDNEFVLDYGMLKEGRLYTFELLAHSDEMQDDKITYYFNTKGTTDWSDRMIQPYFGFIPSFIVWVLLSLLGVFLTRYLPVEDLKKNIASVTVFIISLTLCYLYLPVI